ncbi:hypothetical protein [Symbiopectobacterium sp.]|uniref:hypothetical protein n=1 Tax=Symbiopectobacterium sp. TaxID=2952789 RepID=UPI003F684EF8
MDLWLSTEGGTVLVSLPPQQAVAFIPAQQQAHAEVLLSTDTSWARKQRPPSLHALTLQDFHHQMCRLFLNLRWNWAGAIKNWSGASTVSNRGISSPVRQGG